MTTTFPLWNSCKVSTIILVLFVSVGATHLVHIVRLIRNDEVSTQQISIFQKYFKLIAQVHTHSDSLSSQFAYYAVQQSISITNDISWSLFQLHFFLNFILYSCRRNFYRLDFWWYTKYGLTRIYMWKLGKITLSWKWGKIMPINVMLVKINLHFHANPSPKKVTAAPSKSLK